MRIKNQRLLADVATIISKAGYYMNEATGEIRQGEAFTSLISRLRDYTFRWRNISDLRESDFEDSGYDVLHQGIYYNSPKSPWVAIHSEYKTGKITKGRRVAKSSWIIVSKTPVDREALESKWVAEAEERDARSQLYRECYDRAVAEAMAEGLDVNQAALRASSVAREAMKAI